MNSTALCQDTASLAKCDESHTGTSSHWSLPTRIAFRFTLAYLTLFWCSFVFDPLVPWVAKHVFHIAELGPRVADNGSGDTTLSYVTVFVAFVAAVFVTLVWSVLDRKRTNYARLNQWLRVVARILLGMIMLGYGAAKVIPSQMPAPHMAQLLEPYGESSPMRLLWTFIGASQGYEIFCGAAEMLGGILLFIPSVTTLAALICIAILSNVVMLNLCYDVPVKINSFHFLLMAIFLVAPAVSKLGDIFLFSRAATVSGEAPLFRRRWLNRSAIALQLLLGLAFCVLGLLESHQLAKERAAKSPYDGVWSVEEYAVDGNVQPAVLSESTRWRRVIVDYPQRLTIQFVDAPQEKYLLELDQPKNLLKLTRLGDANWKADISFQNPSGDVLILDGQLDGHRVHAQLHREGERKFLLTSRGFHWVNEFPSNR